MHISLVIASLASISFAVEAKPAPSGNPTWWLWPNINSTGTWVQSNVRYPSGPGPWQQQWGQQWATGPYLRPPPANRPAGHYGVPYPDYGNFFQGYPSGTSYGHVPPYWQQSTSSTTSTSTTSTSTTPTSTTAATTSTTSSSTSSSTSTSTTTSTTPNPRNCTCVPFYQCRESDVVSDGTAMFGGGHHHGQVTTVGNECMYVVEVCCRFPLTTPTPATTSTTTETSSTNTTTPDCGLADAARIWSDGVVQPRIIGPGDGSSATRFGESPWMAAVLEDVGNPSALGFICGGTLVNIRAVLTAAHCVAGKAAVNLRVRLGEWNWKTISDGPVAPQQINVQSVLVHPLYSALPNTSALNSTNNATAYNSTLGTAYRNDVALLILSANVTLSSYVAVICLPNGTQNATPYDPVSCSATGWGVSNPWSHQLSHTLKKVQVSVLGNASCTQALNFTLDNSSLCAGGQKYRDACLGDGGGPLYCRITNSTAGTNRYLLVGVISWGIGKCGTYGKPGIYANVTALAVWINQSIQNSTNTTSATSTTTAAPTTTTSTTTTTTLGPPVLPQNPNYHYDDHDYHSYG